MILTPEQLDLFKELLNLGVGRSASLLNQLTNLHFKLKTLDIRMEDIYSIKKGLISKQNENLSTIELGFQGEFSGIAELVLPSESAIKFTSILTEEPKTPADFNLIKENILTEIANILLNSLMGMISNVLNTHFQYEIPKYTEENMTSLDKKAPMLKAIVLFGEANFAIEDLQIEGFIFIVLKPAAFEELKKALNNLLRKHTST